MIARPRQSRQAAAGFTIAELMMVILIMGLISAAVSLGMDSLLPGERLNTSVRRLAATLQGTRSDAIARNGEFWVEYDLDKEAVRVVTPFRIGGGSMIDDVEEWEDRFALPWDQVEPGVDIASVALAGDQFDQGIVRVRFDPRGAASDHSVILSQPKFESYFTIEVLALTGVIKFHDGIFFREPPDESSFN
ncbi:MAG: prepilin-type N-terminal cleavage/methylation domain-containing protein [Chlamydiales bacterium]|jgi:prepilin-type N-terminal cleavage/methylation domain-containing protein